MAITIPERTLGNCEAVINAISAPCTGTALAGKRVCASCARRVVIGMNSLMPIKLYLEING